MNLVTNILDAQWSAWSHFRSENQWCNEMAAEKNTFNLNEMDDHWNLHKNTKL